LIEFPADDPKRARRFWSGVLGVELRMSRSSWNFATAVPV